MGLLIGVSEITGYLIDLNVVRICGKGERHHSLIAKLLFHFTEIDGVSVNARRCPGLKTINFDTMFSERICQMIGGLQPVRTGILNHIPIETAGFQISSGADHTGPAMVNSPGECLYPAYRIIFCQYIRHFRLTKSQMFCILKRAAHLHTVGSLVRLCPERMHCRSF